MGWLAALYGAMLIAVGKAWLFGGLCLIAGAGDLVPALGDFGTWANVIVYAGAGLLLMRAGYLLRSGSLQRHCRRPRDEGSGGSRINEDRAPARPVR